jgi:hypothetical protein
VLVSAPGLSVVALVLFVLFGSLVAPALFPLQLLDPAWQLRLAGALINTAAFPLLGLALLQIAAELGPHDPQLKNRARLCSQLAVAGAASNADLNQQLQKLQGPVLGPADIAQPLPLLKAQVAAVLDQAALQITREREASQPRTPLLLLPELLRNALASLAIALGFAALARRPGSPRTVLQELQRGWRRSRFGSPGRR